MINTCTYPPRCTPLPGSSADGPGAIFSGVFSAAPGRPLGGANRTACRYRSGVSVRRRTTPAGRLARLGFADAARAERLLSEDLALDAEGADADLLAALAAAADPDLALVTLARMPRDAELADAMRADAGLRNRLTAVLGASAALGDYLVRHPADWHVLSGPDALPPAPPPRRARRCWPRWAPGRTTRSRWPTRPPPRRQPGHRAARRLPAAAAPAGRARPDRRGHRRRDRRRAGRPGRRRARGGAGHRPVRTAGRCRARPAGGDRHGQVRRPRAELRQRRRRDLRRGASASRDDPRSACPGDYPRNPRPPIAAPRRMGRPGPRPKRPRCAPRPSWPPR